MRKGTHIQGVPFHFVYFLKSKEIPLLVSLPYVTMDL